MRNAFYFPHDYNARNDERIIRLRMELGSEGDGIFWMLIEAMHESQGVIDDMKAFAFATHEDEAKVQAVAKLGLSNGLFDASPSGKGIMSKRVQEHLRDREAFLDQQREKGRKGGRRRAEKAAAAKPLPGRRSSLKGEQRKAEKGKEEKGTPPPAEGRGLPKNLMPLAVFTVAKGLKFDNADQLKDHIKRFARASEGLKGYTADQILRAFLFACHEAEDRYDVQLETVGKKIAVHKDWEVPPELMHVYLQTSEEFMQLADVIFSKNSPLICPQSPRN